MIVNVKGYEGILIRLNSTFTVTERLFAKSSVELRYNIILLCKDGVKVEIDDVKSGEIKVIA